MTFRHVRFNFSAHSKVKSDPSLTASTSSILTNRAETRRLNFKAGLNGDDARSRRANSLKKLRKDKTEQIITARRTLTKNVSPPMLEDLPSQLQLVSQAYSQPDATDTFSSVVSLLVQHSHGGSEALDQMIQSGFVGFAIQSCALPLDPLHANHATYRPGSEITKSPENSELISNFLRILVNVSASENPAHVDYLVSNGGVPALLSCANCFDGMVVDLAVTVLGNIAAFNNTYRQLLIDNHLISACFAISCREYAGIDVTNFMKNMIWTIVNCCRGDVRFPDGIGQALANLIAERLPLYLVNCTEAAVSILWGMYFLAEDNNSELIDATFIERIRSSLLTVLQMQDKQLLVPALRFIDALFSQTMDGTFAQLLMSDTLLEALNGFFVEVQSDGLSQGNQDIAESVLHVVGKLAISHPENILGMDDPIKIISSIMMILSGDCKVDVRKAALITLSNIQSALSRLDDEVENCVRDRARQMAADNYHAVVANQLLVDDSSVQSAAVQVLACMLNEYRVNLSRRNYQSCVGSVPDEVVNKLEVLSVSNEFMFGKVGQLLDLHFRHENDEEERINLRVTV